MQHSASMASVGGKTAGGYTATTSRMGMSHSASMGTLRTQTIYLRDADAAALLGRSASTASLRTSLRPPRITSRPLLNHPPQAPKQYLGPQKFVTAKLPRIPAVDFERGGTDFRCLHPQSNSCIGKQILSSKITTYHPRVKFERADRFPPEYRRSPGPIYWTGAGLQKQIVSKHRTAPAVGFGASPIPTLTLTVAPTRTLTRTLALTRTLRHV